MPKTTDFELTLNGFRITESTVMMDNRFKYTEHIDSILKKASSRVILLSRIRSNLTPHAAETNYRLMILPLLVYSNIVFKDMSPKHRNTISKDYKWQNTLS